ncbi:hypothetical protein GCM10010297_47950 [Streptomyces malachitofuscus]|nr:hypothetical protein GCM10010297_47950 [Streptomyces malachitofuscus]
MNKRFAKRVGTFAATSALIVGTSLTLGATEAAAAEWTFEKGKVHSSGSFTISADNNGTYAGLMSWNADPIGDIPGDSFRVLDRLSDGWGMEAKMINPVTGRTATTRGHKATYFSPWSTGNLTEGTKVYIQLCAFRGSSRVCSPAYSGHA